MIKQNKMIFLIVVLSFLTSCIIRDNRSSNNSIDLSHIPTPKPGYVTAFGQVVGKENIPISGKSIWLAQVFEGDGGIFILDTLNSPNTIADNTGFFVFSNIIPGDYVIVVGDPEISYEIISVENGKAKVWKLDSDKIVDLGILYLSNE